MIRCYKCGYNSLPEYHYCVRCGTSLREFERFKRGRYGAVERIANGYRFISRLVAAFGIMSAIGVFVYFWPKSLMASIFFCIAAGVFTYLASVGMKAVSELLFLMLDIENNSRIIAESAVKGDKSER